MKRKLITPIDLVVITLTVAFAFLIAFAFSSSDSGNIAVVTISNKQVATFNLNTPLRQKITTLYGYNTLIIENGRCRVETADCRDGICINRGEISKVGESIVCLPHKLIVEIR